mgnify:CR=1 FL=1
MQNDLFEKWYSLSFPNSSLERNEDGSYFRRKTNFSLESFEAGQQSKQAEVDELQKRIDEAMKYVSESPLKDVSRRAMINFMDILKGNTNDH